MLEKAKEKIWDTILGLLAVCLLVGGFNLWVDVDRLKASESNMKEDLHSIKRDVKDIHNYLLGEKKK